MKIVHINTLERSGGAARVALRLCLAQQEAGHEAQMLVGRKESPVHYSHRLEHQVAGSLRDSFLQKGLLYYEVQGSHFIIEHPLVQSADLLHLHNIHGGYFNPFSLALLGQLKPIVWTLHDMQAFTGHCAHSLDCEKWQNGCVGCNYLEVYPHIQVDSAARLWNDKREIYNHTPFQIVTPSRWLKSKVQKSIMAHHPLEIIPNGVDTSVFQAYDKHEARSRLGLPTKAFIVGGVANGGALFNGWKGGSYTIKALRELFAKKSNSFYLSVGSSRREVDWDDHLINLPPVDSEDEMAWIYSAMDLYLMTSVAENFPLVLLEALACGVPVLSFATGGVPELVTNGVEGVVVGYRDIVGLSQALLVLSENSKLLKLFSANAREKAVSRFEHSKIASLYEKTYLNYINLWKEDLDQFALLDPDKISPEIASAPFLKALSIVKIKQQLEKSR